MKVWSSKYDAGMSKKCVSSREIDEEVEMGS